MEQRIELKHRLYKELSDERGDWRRMLKEFESFTRAERRALLSKPTGYNPEEVYAVVAECDNKIVGGHIMFTTRLAFNDEVVLAQTGSHLYALEEYQKKNVGAFVFFDSMKLLKSRNGLYFGISQRALGLYKALKFTIFEYPRFIYLIKSRSVIQRYLKSESILTKPIVGLADLGLLIHRKLVIGMSSKSSKYRVEKCGQIPDDVIRIIGEDNHPYKEIHDREWMEWSLFESFREDGVEKTLYTVTNKGVTEAFYTVKKEFLEQASSRGFKNVILGTIVEWGISPKSSLREDQLYLLAIYNLDTNVDALQVATTSEDTARMLKKKLFAHVGNSNMAVKINDCKIEDIDDISKWRLRIGSGGIMID